ncbi:MAG: hypothetical protein HRU26_05690 [Psychroserpens sp.]|nr:hypothetical protein [Psychroserpens sp.]
MSTVIEVIEEVQNITITVTEVDNTVTLQPVISRNSSGSGGGDMLKAVYDPANKEEQVLTINDTLDGGTITV